MLCGESAGGGLICALCLKLKQLGRELPCGLIAISPWVDLTGSGKSYEFNRDNDPSLTEELLREIYRIPLTVADIPVPGGSVKGCVYDT